MQTLTERESVNPEYERICSPSMYKLRLNFTSYHLVILLETLQTIFCCRSPRFLERGEFPHARDESHQTGGLRVVLGYSSER
jgi:hypothetical protein